MSAMRASSIPGVVLLAFLLPGVALGGSWQTVIAGKYETIEIDQASIAKADSGATAWSRITLDREVKAAGGAYDAIRAQNLYDCKARRFTTQRRLYFHGEMLVREDVISRQRANAVEVGSIDERLFNVACRKAAMQGAPAERPPAIHADLQLREGDPAVSRVTPVADTTPVAAAEKPKLIILPPIDKAAADKAAAEQDAAGSGHKPAVPAVKAKGQGPASDGSSVPTPAATWPGAPRQEPETAADKRLRELHYATSGPRKAATKRQVPGERGNPAARMQVQWSYEGEGGPAHWARLQGDYATCGTGKRQSPIDIREGIRVSLEEIKFDYKPTQFRIIDTGHTVQVNVGEGLGLKVMGKRHELLHLHFHRPAEERINGRTYDMGVHFMHRDDAGRLAVVVVFLEKGSEHPLIQTLWNHLPLEQGMEMAPEEAIDLNTLLPENRAYWTYMGSLTTPPCTEGVVWMVLKQTVHVSPEQLAIFARVYRNNARPLQAANGRLVKESR